MRRTHLVVFLSLLGVTACSGGGEGSGDKGTDGGNPNSPLGLTGWMTLRSQAPGQETYYSGRDGTNIYQIPIAFVGDGDIQFAVMDTSIASIVTTIRADHSMYASIPDGVVLRIVLLKTGAAGTTTVNATFAGKTYPCTLMVTAYAPSDVTLGDQRYNNPANPNTTTRIACNSCHMTLNKHSTALLGDLSPDEILHTAVDGIGVALRNPNTGEVQTYQPLNGMHKWDVTAAERVGIVAFLRSRDPLFQLPQL
jgi:hypothetical protein